MISSATVPILRASAAAVLTASAAVAGLAAAPAADAAVCNDVEVVFARGTLEDPGIGRVGQAFVNELRNRIGYRTMGVYAVNYPASYDFLAAADGANDASAYIQNIVNNCPNTKLVLGGYSQGAAVIDIITSVLGGWALIMAMKHLPGVGGALSAIGASGSLNGMSMT